MMRRAASVSLRPSADLGLGLGGPWVAQAWPKGHPSVTQARPKGRFTKVLCLQQKLEKGGGGHEIAEIARHPTPAGQKRPELGARYRRNRKDKTFETRRNGGNGGKGKILPQICADER